jgi:hypothetical protein
VSQPIYRPRKRKTNKLYLVASAVIAILVIASFALGGLGGGGNRGASTGGAKEYVEGVGVQQELMPTGSDGLGLHVPDSQSVVYNTVPPTSGDHWRTPARCGFYPDGTPDEQIVHNLEHGNIVVSYNLTDPAQIDQLTEVVDGIGFADLWGITRFYDQIPEGQVALTTWGVLDIMEGVDRDRIRAFFDYAGNLGPEIGPC